MIAASLAVACLVASGGFLFLVFVAGFLGRRSSDGEFSWGRYVVWLVVALIGAALLVAARTTWVFLTVAGVLLLWVLLRAAADAQATTIREKVGFLQLYLALLIVEYAALLRAGALAGVRASASFSYVIDDTLAHLVLPVLSLIIGLGGPERASPGAFVGSVAGSVASHLLLDVALGTFALAAFVYAHFAEHATPKLGVSLLPGPTPSTLVFASLWAIAWIGGRTPALIAEHAAIVLTPYFVSEGLWVVNRLGSRLRTRRAWAALLAALALLFPPFCGALATLGWTFHLVRLRARVFVLRSQLRLGRRRCSCCSRSAMPRFFGVSRRASVSGRTPAPW
jgi:hypothetical protein